MQLFKKIKSSFWWRLNRIRLKINNVVYGKGCVINGHLYIRIHENAKVTIGDFFSYTSGGGINPICTNIQGGIFVDDNAILEIGDHTGCSSTVIWVRKSVKIGSYCSIGGGTLILDSDAHSLNYIHRRSNIIDQENRIDKGIVIGDDCLIGAKCMILKGVHIGSRSIIGAGSVVTKDIPSDCIAAGNPAKVIRYINNVK